MKLQYVGPGSATEEHDRYKRSRVKVRVRRDRTLHVHDDESDMEYRRLMRDQQGQGRDGRMRGLDTDGLDRGRHTSHRNRLRGDDRDEESHRGSFGKEAATAAAGVAALGLGAGALKHEHDKHGKHDKHDRRGRLGERHGALGSRHSRRSHGSSQSISSRSSNASGSHSRLGRRSSAHSVASSGGGRGGLLTTGILGRLFGKKDAELRSSKSTAAPSVAGDIDRFRREQDEDVLENSRKVFGFYEVPENYRFVIEKDGRFVRVLFPGSHRLSHGERVADIHNLSVETLEITDMLYTWDRLEVFVSATLFIRVDDPVTATYEVQNPRKSISLLATSVLRWLISRVPVDDIYIAVEDLSSESTIIINQNICQFGWRCVRVVLNIEILPEIRQQMLQRAQAERHGQFELQRQRTAQQLRDSHHTATLGELAREQRAGESARLFAMRSELEARRLARENRHEEVELARQDGVPVLDELLTAQREPIGPVHPILDSEVPFDPQFDPQYGPQFNPQYGPQYGPWHEGDLNGGVPLFEPGATMIPPEMQARMGYPEMDYPVTGPTGMVPPGMLGIPPVHRNSVTGSRIGPGGYPGHWQGDPRRSISVPLEHPDAAVDYEAMDPQRFAPDGPDMLEAGSVGRGSMHGSVPRSALGSMRNSLRSSMHSRRPGSLRSLGSRRGPVVFGDQGEELPIAGGPMM